VSLNAVFPKLPDNHDRAHSHSFWISTKVPVHDPSIHTTKTITLGEYPPTDLRHWTVSVLSRDHWCPVLLLLYGSPLSRPAHVWCSSPHLGQRTFLVFYTVGFFFFRDKKIVLDWGKDCRGEGERGTKRERNKNFIKFSPHVR
jgi:hypothetical protein